MLVKTWIPNYLQELKQTMSPARVLLFDEAIAHQATVSKEQFSQNANINRFFGWAILSQKQLYTRQKSADDEEDSNDIIKLLQDMPVYK